MAKIFNKLKIEVNARLYDIITGLVSVQNDSNSRHLDVFLYDNGFPIDLTEHEVRIYMRKPDGTEIFNNGEITDAVNGRCQFELTSQALGAVGVLKCEISMWKNNVEILTTQTFHIFVTESLRSDGSIESSNEYGALVVLFQNLYQSIDLMQNMVANFGTPSGTVDADTFWKMLEKLYEVNEAALANASVSEVLNRIGQSTDEAGSGTLFGAVNPLNVKIDEWYNEWYNNNYRPDEYLQASVTPTESKTVVNREYSASNGNIINLGYVNLPSNWSSVKVTAVMLSQDGTNVSRIFYSNSSGPNQNNYSFSPELSTTATTYTTVVRNLDRATVRVNDVSNNMYFHFQGYGGGNTGKIKSLIVDIYTYELVTSEEKYKIGTMKRAIIPAGTADTYSTITFSQLPPIDRIDGLVVTGTNSINNTGEKLKILDYNSKQYVLQLYNSQPVRILY